jgi:tetratricopeptide (TPR) repeat protein
MEKAIEKNNKGVNFFLNEDFENAELQYKAALEEDKDNATALNNLGLLYHQKGEYKQAAEYFKKAISIKSKDTYYLNLANSLVYLKDYNEAEVAYKKSLDINPENVNTKISLAKFYESIDRINDAIRYWEDLVDSYDNESFDIELVKKYMALAKYEKAISLLYNVSSKGENALVYYYIGICEFNLKNFGNAEIAFKKSLGIKPDFTDARHYLAINYLSKGEYFNAIKEFDYIITIEPENHKVKLDKAIVYLNIGEYVKAEEIIENICKLDPRNQKANYYRNVVYNLLKSK